MKRYGIIGLIVMVLISVSMNFYQYGEIRKAESQLTVVNNRVLDNIEQYARWSIRFLDEIQGMRESENSESMSETTFRHLESSLEDLVEYYAYFVDLRLEEFGEEGVCTQSLESLRSIRNVVKQNLQEKFEMNEFRYTANDYVFLQELEEVLETFLSSMYRISEANENQLVIEIPGEEQENLLKISEDLMELASRYRHGTLVENEEDLLSEEEAEAYLLELAGNWMDPKNLEEGEIDGPHHRNGITHYALETEGLLLWIDGKSGNLRYLEYSPEGGEGMDTEITRRQALEIAREFYREFQETTYEDLKEEIFVYNQEDNGETVYGFRFTPMDRGIRLSSDAFEVNVGAGSQEITRYRNQFDETPINIDARGNLAMLEISEGEEKENTPLSAERIKEVHEESFPTMEYRGRAVIRNYYTEFQPRVVKVFFEEIEGQRAALYFDEYTGRELDRGYYPYEPF
ncbi:YcdB/YcdC domain-containing protein [Isachenkonia alkalipeptolytica]|uniref:YcdB/YcdC repeated domain-containing protein n=1 Tax=Isachenkonia alkalipeptolytica TaxID=2565777 RepID=A0AA43XIL1_9CLOT|nr:YcdB/YcdC domain-containing protein [Isachenkonia alkalipeptolytica]NBG87505.1 hypothetical protein [Isachenkonia alkalipeptolytica]